MALDVATTSDGKVVAVGGAGDGPDVVIGVLKLTASGNLDTSFSGDGKMTISFSADPEIATGVKIDVAGRIVIAADF